MSAVHVILALVIGQRILELAHSRRNARRLLAEGGVESGAGHYPLFFVVHGGWLASMAVLVPADATVWWPVVGGYALLQAGRLWVIVALGRYWTTRVITVPDAPLVRRGPYRFCRHPNYAIVAAEIAVLPLAFGAWHIALAFSALNLPLIAHRVRVEDRALAPRRCPSGGGLAGASPVRGSTGADRWLGQ